MLCAFSCVLRWDFIAFVISYLWAWRASDILRSCLHMKETVVTVCSPEILLPSSSLSSILASLVVSLIKTHRGSQTPTRTVPPHCQTLSAAAKTCFPVCLCQMEGEKNPAWMKGGWGRDHIYLILAFQNMASHFSASAAEVQIESRKESSAAECLFKWGLVERGSLLAFESWVNDKECWQKAINSELFYLCGISWD